MPARTPLPLAFRRRPLRITAPCPPPHPRCLSHVSHHAPPRHSLTAAARSTFPAHHQPPKTATRLSVSRSPHAAGSLAPQVVLRNGHRALAPGDEVLLDYQVKAMAEVQMKNHAQFLIETPISAVGRERMVHQCRPLLLLPPVRWHGGSVVKPTQ